MLFSIIFMIFYNIFFNNIYIPRLKTFAYFRTSHIYIYLHGILFWKTAHLTVCNKPTTKTQNIKQTGIKAATTHKHTHIYIFVCVQNLQKTHKRTYAKLFTKPHTYMHIHMYVGIYVIFMACAR